MFWGIRIWVLGSRMIPFLGELTAMGIITADSPGGRILEERINIRSTPLKEDLRRVPCHLLSASACAVRKYQGRGIGTEICAVAQRGLRIQRGLGRLRPSMH